MSCIPQILLGPSVIVTMLSETSRCPETSALFGRWFQETLSGKETEGIQQCPPGWSVCCLKPFWVISACLCLLATSNSCDHGITFPGSYLLVIFLPVSSQNLLQTDQYLALPDVCFNLKSPNSSHCRFIGIVLRANRALSHAQETQHVCSLSTGCISAVLCRETLDSTSVSSSAAT